MLTAVVRASIWKLNALHFFDLPSILFVIVKILPQHFLFSHYYYMIRNSVYRFKDQWRFWFEYSNNKSNTSFRLSLRNDSSTRFQSQLSIECIRKQNHLNISERILFGIFDASIGVHARKLHRIKLKRQSYLENQNHSTIFPMLLFIIFSFFHVLWKHNFERQLP